jgi:hypothetical protein
VRRTKKHKRSLTRPRQPLPFPQVLPAALAAARHSGPRACDAAFELLASLLTCHAAPALAAARGAGPLLGPLLAGCGDSDPEVAAAACKALDAAVEASPAEAALASLAARLPADGAGLEARCGRLGSGLCPQLCFCPSLRGVKAWPALQDPKHAETNPACPAATQLTRPLANPPRPPLCSSSSTGASASAELAANLRALLRAAVRSPTDALAAAAAAGPLLPGLLAVLGRAPAAAARRGAVMCLSELTMRLGDRWGAGSQNLHGDPGASACVAAPTPVRHPLHSALLVSAAHPVYAC